MSAKGADALEALIAEAAAMRPVLKGVGYNLAAVHMLLALTPNVSMVLQREGELALPTEEEIDKNERKLSTVRYIFWREHFHQSA